MLLKTTSPAALVSVVSAVKVAACHNPGRHRWRRVGVDVRREGHFRGLSGLSADLAAEDGMPEILSVSVLAVASLTVPLKVTKVPLRTALPLTVTGLLVRLAARRREVASDRRAARAVGGEVIDVREHRHGYRTAEGQPKVEEAIQVVPTVSVVPVR